MLTLLFFYLFRIVSHSASVAMRMDGSSLAPWRRTQGPVLPVLARSLR